MEAGYGEGVVADDVKALAAEGDGAVDNVLARAVVVVWVVLADAGAW